MKTLMSHLHSKKEQAARCAMDVLQGGPEKYALLAATALDLKPTDYPYVPRYSRCS